MFEPTGVEILSIRFYCDYHLEWMYFGFNEINFNNSGLIEVPKLYICDKGAYTNYVDLVLGEVGNLNTELFQLIQEVPEVCGKIHYVRHLVVEDSIVSNFISGSNSRLNSAMNDIFNKYKNTINRFSIFMKEDSLDNSNLNPNLDFLPIIRKKLPHINSCDVEYVQVQNCGRCQI